MANKVDNDTFAKLIAESESAAKRYQDLVRDIGHKTTGTWYGVPGLTDSGEWVFYRAGTKASAAAHALAHLMKQQGWVDAPAGVRCIGFEAWDAGEGGGLYLAAPRHVYREMCDIADKIRRRRSPTTSSLTEEIGSRLAGTGASIERLEVDLGEAGEQEFASGNAAPRRKSR